jgi:hypothetical protein
MRYEPPRWPLHGPLLAAVCLLVFLGVLLLGCSKALAEPDEVDPIVGSRLIMVGFCLDNEDGWIGVRQIQHARDMGATDEPRARKIFKAVFLDPRIPCIHVMYNRFNPIEAIVEAIVETRYPASVGCTLWVRVYAPGLKNSPKRAITWRGCYVDMPGSEA